MPLREYNNSSIFKLVIFPIFFFHTYLAHAARPVAGVEPRKSEEGSLGFSKACLLATLEQLQRIKMRLGVSVFTCEHVCVCG